MLGTLVALLFGYSIYYHAWTGTWGLTTASGGVLYGRTAQIADCSRLALPAGLQQICPTEPLSARLGVDYYAHFGLLAGWPGYLPPNTTVSQMQHQFAMIVLRTQPWDVARSILVDFSKGFGYPRQDYTADDATNIPLSRWQFQTSYPLFANTGPNSPDTEAFVFAEDYGGEAPTVNTALATILRGYQLYGGYTPGPLLALCGLLGVIGGIAGNLTGRRNGRNDVGVRNASAARAALLATAMALIILFGSAMFEFSWRYQLPGLVLLPLGGVLGLTALLGPSRRGSRRRGLAPFPDPVDTAALADFTARHGEPTFAPVLVVIAAYREESGIGGVLDNLPRQCCDLEVDVLVVVDGGGDRTAEVASEHGGYVCAAPTNRGQGAALRLGYQLAALGGAEFVVTTDADGQYEAAEMPLLLRPLLDGEADFVTGSRRLGTEDTDDRVRSVGVRVFAALATVLTLRKITDTSFGFRAMRTELASSVRLRQPQYQASELLMGVLAGGARLMERPMTMRVRSAGKTKKGNNLVYGLNYARVMTWSWLREFVLASPARVTWAASRRRLPSTRFSSANLTTNSAP